MRPHLAWRCWYWMETQGDLQGKIARTKLKASFNFHFQLRRPSDSVPARCYFFVEQTLWESCQVKDKDLGNKSRAAASQPIGTTLRRSDG